MSDNIPGPDAIWSGPVNRCITCNRDDDEPNNSLDYYVDDEGEWYRQHLDCAVRESGWCPDCNEAGDANELNGSGYCPVHDTVTIKAVGLHSPDGIPSQKPPDFSPP